jgi:hypothetical protein
MKDFNFDAEKVKANNIKINNIIGDETTTTSTTTIKPK